MSERTVASPTLQPQQLQQQQEQQSPVRPPFRHIVHAVMLSSASHVFWVSSFVSYWCTPSYGFNLVTGTYFFVVYFWPGTVYVNEIGSFFPHKDKNANHVRMPLREIFKRIAISASFMTSVVVIASLVQGRLALPYSEKINSALCAITPSWLAAGWNWLSTPSATTDASSALSTPSLLNLFKMTCGWGFSFVTHFIGFGLIPRYLNKWWTAVKLSAVALFEEEKKAKQDQAAATGGTDRARSASPTRSTAKKDN